MTPAEVDALIARLRDRDKRGWDDHDKAAAALAAMQARIAEIEDERETYRRAWVREEAARMEAEAALAEMTLDRDAKWAWAIEAEKDAERLSWLDRDDIKLEFGVDSFNLPYVAITCGRKQLSCEANIRAAIDAAIAQEGK